MEIIIVRHAEPNYDIDSLTLKGRREAKLLAKKLTKIYADGYYCSPLGRAKKTASYTMKYLKNDVEILPWLEEFRGKVKIDGKTTNCWDRLPSQWSENPTYYTKDWYKTNLMQSANAEQEYKIVCNGVDELLNKYGYEHTGNYYKVNDSNHKKIILFCHFGVEAVILSHIIGVSPMFMWHNFVALPSSVTRLVTEEREKGEAVFRITAFGDTGHLFAGGEEPSFMARWCECYDDKTRH